MKTKLIISIIWLGLLTGQCFAQATYGGNDFTGAPVGSFLGWDNSVPTGPLQIRHDANQPILFSTNTIERMRIAQYGNVGIGATSPRAKLAVQLYQSSAAAPPNFESTTVFANNSFPGNEQFLVNRGVRAMARGFSVVLQTGNRGGTFWATNGNSNINPHQSHRSGTLMTY